jgi:hypothetical protein
LNEETGSNSCSQYGKAKRFSGYKHVMGSLNTGKEDEFFKQIKAIKILVIYIPEKLSEDLKSLPILIPTGRLFNSASLNKVYN